MAGHGPRRRQGPSVARTGIMLPTEAAPAPETSLPGKPVRYGRASRKERQLRLLLPETSDRVNLFELYSREVKVPAGRPFVRVNMVSTLDGAVAFSGRAGSLGGPGGQAAFLRPAVLGRCRPGRSRAPPAPSITGRPRYPPRRRNPPSARAAPRAHRGRGDAAQARSTGGPGSSPAVARGP